MAYHEKRPFMGRLLVRASPRHVQQPFSRPLLERGKLSPQLNNSWILPTKTTSY